MDAVCAKVDAANRVTLLSSTLNFSLFFLFGFLAPPSGRSAALYTPAYAQAELGGEPVVGSDWGGGRV